MAVITDREARNVPFFIDYFHYASISTANYSPIDDPSFDQEELGTIEQKGFLVRPNADGDFYGITLYAYQRNLNATTKVPTLTGLTPTRYLGSQNQWIECRFVKIYAHNDGVYASTCTAVNIGITI
jgi:hypothetical protein